MTALSRQPQPSFVFLQSEAGSKNKREKTISCKHQGHKGIFVSETGKYTISLITTVYNLFTKLTFICFFKVSYIKDQYEA